VRCVECHWRFEAPGGPQGQQIPVCPLCALRAKLAEAVRERDEARDRDGLVTKLVVTAIVIFVAFTCGFLVGTATRWGGGK
jgi:multisubunit Na+/H+ antiporter MnhC subunit